MITPRELEVLLIEVDTWQGETTGLNSKKLLASKDVLARIETLHADATGNQQKIERAFEKLQKFQEFMQEFMGQFQGSHDDAIRIDEKIEDILGILYEDE